MPTNKTVSICIPTYNNEKYISETLKSILNQTYQNFEIIVTDDASSDRTVEIIESFHDPRIKIFQNIANSGITANWNHSISLATGDYIKLVCGDDILYPTCIEKQINILENDFNSTIALVTSCSDVINSRGEAILKRKSLLKPGLNSPGQVVKKCMRFGTNLIGEPVVGMFRRESLKQGLKYDGSNPYMIDLDFWFQLLETGKLYLVDYYLAAFRVSSESISSSLKFSQFQAVKKFMQCQRERQKINIADEFIGTINAFFVTILRNLIFAASAKKF
jgi:glycosyltransferase involved in cell wall biosynthesis